MKKRPTRLGERARGGVCQAALTPLAIVAGSSATAADINGQHRPAACFDVPCSGQGSGGGACSGQSVETARSTNAAACAIDAVPSVGTTKAINATSQRKARARIIVDYIERALPST